MTRLLALAAAAALLAGCEPPQPEPRVGMDGRPVEPFGAPPAPSPFGSAIPATGPVPWDGVIRDTDSPDPVTLPPRP